MRPESLYNGDMMKSGYTYIMGSHKLALYTGVTSNLIQRVYQHKHNLVPGFTAKYKCHKLLYYEVFDSIEQAIIREKQIKNLNRIDKINLIKTTNPNLKDLYSQILDKPE
jgi:putative endonuclease